MDYQLEIKQIVDYPRCRIYREFLQTLMKDRTIRTNGSSYLFYFMILCSYANFRSSYRRLEGISYLVGPGEWICKTSELSEWFRTRFQHQAISILSYLQDQHYIAYTKLGRGNLIKFSINGWKQHNSAFEYNYPCLKDAGFFFFPIASVHELISMGKCSEMDIVLDLWIHAIYNDEQVQGSEVGPVVYFRNCTGEKSYEKLWASIETSRSTTFVRYLVAMDIPMIGRTASRALDQYFKGNLRALEQAAVERFDFTCLPDFGETLSTNIQEWFRNSDHILLWRNLQKELTFEEIKEENTMSENMNNNPFNGLTIVATGKLENFTRDSINSKIISLGAIAGSSVTKKTDYLICGEKAGSKLAKAQELGVKVLSEQEFLNMISA